MQKLVLRVKLGLYSLIRADERAGTAAGAVSGHISDLFHNLDCFSGSSWCWYRSFGMDPSLHLYRRHNGLDRAYCGAFTASFAAIIPPAYDIRELP
jgi:hypothetical protein